MAEGLQFAALATLVGRKNAARWGKRRVTVGAVGKDHDGRWVQATLSDGTVILGDVGDFTVPERKSRKARA